MKTKECEGDNVINIRDRMNKVISDNINTKPDSTSSKRSQLNVILHFHGGGFISGDPVAHEVYLRDWARETGALIISVDYSLAPKHKWPTPVDECFYVYKWLVENNPWGINPTKILVTGDSAGGNLVFTTTYKTITENIRVPDGLLAAYPAVDLTKDTVTPSRILFINDVLVPYHALLVCHEYYFPPGTDTKNPLCSPLYADDSLLKNLPEELAVLTAGLDPLNDDVMKYIQRLEGLNKPVQHYNYRGVPHGFLNFGQVIPTATEAKNQSTKILVEMFHRLAGKDNVNSL